MNCCSLPICQFTTTHPHPPSALSLSLSHSLTLSHTPSRSLSLSLYLTLPLSPRISSNINPIVPSIAETRSTLVTRFILRRRRGYFILQIYAPCSMIVGASWVAFWINRNDAAGRVAVGELISFQCSTSRADGPMNGAKPSAPWRSVTTSSTEDGRLQWRTMNGWGDFKNVRNVERTGAWSWGRLDSLTKTAILSAPRACSVSSSKSDSEVVDER